MKCYHPLRAFRRSSGGIEFSEAPGDRESLELPCGKCVGCRLARAQAWAVRCRHEAMLYDRNCFITLTYDDDHQPAHGSLNYSDVQRFFKRLRKRFHGESEAPNGQRPIRFFVAGEYGSTTFRPHYHALIFNYDFRDDARPWGRNTYRSRSLEELWPYGSSLVGPLTPATAAYTARYALKKVSYGSNPDHYDASSVDPDTGEVHVRTPEFVRMSRRPGIGQWWFDKYWRDLYPLDAAIYDGRPVPVPTYYRRKLQELDPLLSEEVEHERFQRGSSVPYSEKTDERRSVSETVAKARLSHFHGERGF